MTDAPIPRDSATLILVRHGQDAPRILMGQRGRSASFMPDKFVFPGGALDPHDRELAPKTRLTDLCAARLDRRCDSLGLGPALALAAIRETFEETGLAIGTADGGATADTAPDGWREFVGRGLMPSLDRLRFVFRAITPPTRPKRFDARFFLAQADAVVGDLDDFSAASGELTHLQWVDLAQARALDLPFITRVVLAEVEEILRDPAADRAAPFFWHDETGSYVDPL
jgi:8-oxo-dGTP pyrophosphatase MutT (NUDIX family)